MNKRVFSGVQPSQSIMLGNYLGAIKNWVKLQLDHDCIYCIVNSHAITLPQDPKELLARTLEVTATYIACGVDPSKSTIFVQSQVSAHAELAWVLSCHTWMGELSRMTQFKDKSVKQKMIGSGLFLYPVLMAADILLYQAHLVPVGHDQKQHLELARDIAIRMNGLYSEKKKDKPDKLFVVPEPYISPVAARIMSLQDPTMKMSKSDPIPNATVFLLDSDDVIERKIKRSVTDSGTVIEYTNDKPGIRNLIEIQSAILDKKSSDIVKTYEGKLYGHLKTDTAQIVVESLRPIRVEINKLLADQSELNKILKSGKEKAETIASTTLKQVYDAIGFLS